MKVIFLDIDGVLMSFDNLRAMSVLKIKDSDAHGHLFDKRCVHWLDAIIGRTGAQIVISSSWRLAGLKHMQHMWMERGLPGNVVGITSLADFDCDERGNQIKLWLDNNPVDSYVIIDDNTYDIVNVFDSNVVKTDGEVGLTHSDAKKAIDILGGSL